MFLGLIPSRLVLFRKQTKSLSLIGMFAHIINVLLLCLYLLFYCFREDEHALIQQYCQTLGGESPVSQPQSPAQILKSVEKEERGELERIIADLEEEQRSHNHPTGV